VISSAPSIYALSFLFHAKERVFSVGAAFFFLDFNIVFYGIPFDIAYPPGGAPGGGPLLIADPGFCGSIAYGTPCPY
jgi:hypothetical protein